MCGARLYDSSFLALSMFCSSLPYIRGLGLYDDDWGYLATYTYCSDRSYWGLIKCFYRDNGDPSVRPLQNLYVSGLYWLFGPHPSVHHAVNSALLACAVVLLYQTLSELGLSRIPAVAIALIYGLLPHYSTDRFWLASAAASNQSMAFCFLSFYSAARVFRSCSRRRWAWMTASILAMLASLLAYEVAAPLMVLVPLIMYIGFSRSATVQGAIRPERSTSRLIFLLSMASLALFIALKLKLQTRVGIHGRFLFLSKLDLIFQHAASQFFEFNVGKYGLGLPVMAWHALSCRLGPEIKVITVLFAVALFSYLLLATSDLRERPGIRVWGGLIVVGVVLFGLGYAIWATDYTSEFANLGIANRITAAAAVGTAFLLVGTLGLTCALLPNAKASRWCFCALVTVFATSGFAVIQGVASFWVESANQQKMILDDIRAHVKSLPPKSTLLVDGIYVYVGPGPVFLWDGDTASALQLLFHVPSLNGDVINTTASAEKLYISKFTYGFEYHYAYGNNLWLYNYRTKRLIQLSSFEIAQRYFEGFNPQSGGVCAPPCGDYGTATCFSH